LDMGADINGYFLEVASIHAAIRKHDPVLLEFLLERRASVDHELHYNFEKSFIHTAVSYENLRIIELLHQYGAPLYERDKLNKTPLMYAFCNKSYPIMDYLIKHGPKGCISDPFFSCAMLHIAVSRQDEEMVTFLCNHGADVDAKDNLGHTPLFFAAKEKSTKIVDILYHNGADFSIFDSIDTDFYSRELASYNSKTMKYIKQLKMQYHNAIKNCESGGSFPDTARTTSAENDFVEEGVALITQLETIQEEQIEIAGNCVIS
ncbi:MAG: ankyrin repeat domain-containing protein, partial [Rickettsiaceae bacterium]|nr:ankyrin repeat domain-containing protein [Rickettsiaceae bacterium]